MYTFSICYLLRTSYEAYENIRNNKALQDDDPSNDLPSIFYSDVETMIIYLAFIDSPIALIFYLHFANSSQRAT